MRVTRLQLANWRNFKTVDVSLADRVFVLGPNASGKSNLLDAVRFLHELTMPAGGLYAAVGNRGGMSRLRFVNARNFNRGLLSVSVAIGDDDIPNVWEYELALKSSRPDLPAVAHEIVRHAGAVVYEQAPSTDPKLATQTALEQVAANGPFRELAEYLSGIEYLHLVPQIVRDPARGVNLARDPYGGTFLSEIGRSGQREWERRRRVLTTALRAAVPQFESLDRHQDRDGTWHLQAKYTTWRRSASAQDERDFSDGTLRLLGLLWVLLDRSKLGAPVLLEEPELSLHHDILTLLPQLMATASAGSGRQVLATTHGVAMFDDDGVRPDEVVILVPASEGTTVRLASADPLVEKLVSDGAFTLLEALRADLTVKSVRDLVTLKLA